MSIDNAPRKSRSDTALGRVSAVLAKASRGLTLNEIVAATGLPIARVSAALLELETQSCARFRSGRWSGTGHHEVPS